MPPEMIDPIRVVVYNRFRRLELSTRSDQAQTLVGPRRRPFGGSGVELSRICVPQPPGYVQPRARYSKMRTGIGIPISQRIAQPTFP
jgi:hypothetical protein